MSWQIGFNIMVTIYIVAAVSDRAATFRHITQLRRRLDQACIDIAKLQRRYEQLSEPGKKAEPSAPSIPPGP